MIRVFVLLLVLVIVSISGCIHLSNIQESYALKQYKNETIGIEFLYSDDWYIVESKFLDNNKSVAVSPVSPKLYDASTKPPDSFTYPKYRTGINIFEHQDVNINNATEDYKDILADTLDFAFSWQARLINNTSALLGVSTDSPIESHLVDYDFDYDDSYITWKNVDYIFMNENKDKLYSIQIDASAGQYFVNRDNFKTILDSLKLINQR